MRYHLLGSCRQLTGARKAGGRVRSTFRGDSASLKPVHGPFLVAPVLRQPQSLSWTYVGPRLICPPNRVAKRLSRNQRVSGESLAVPCKLSIIFSEKTPVLHHLHDSYFNYFLTADLLNRNPLPHSPSAGFLMPARLAVSWPALDCCRWFAANSRHTLQVRPRSPHTNLCKGRPPLRCVLSIPCRWHSFAFYQFYQCITTLAG